MRSAAGCGAIGTRPAHRRLRAAAIEHLDAIVREDTDPLLREWF
ncbi:MAG TPA: hypothetical protein VNO26_14215 [Candidatus Limnocylindria bacterium]|nr:hypothetical protein [Candidatus Limnocylindria bacterium]